MHAGLNHRFGRSPGIHPNLEAVFRLEDRDACAETPGPRDPEPITEERSVPLVTDNVDLVRIPNDLAKRREMAFVLCPDSSMYELSFHAWPRDSVFKDPTGA